jgi:ABC-type transport system involved in multi-copper enzyme maturation permease subunit
MNNLLKITGYTILDQFRNRSFYMLLGVSMVMVMMLRGCYSGNVSFNGQQVDGVNLAWEVSKIAFQIITFGVYLMVAMLAMKLFSRDHEDGSAVMFLSRPIQRREYVLGRVLGTWLLSIGFMLLLHGTIFFTVWSKTGGVTPEFMVASLVCSINLLFVILCVSLLSLYMPDFIAALFTLGIVFVGFISDGGHQLMTNSMVKAMTSRNAAAPHLPLWRILYPKLFMVQSYAGSLISHQEFNNIGPVHPRINVLLFVVLLGGVLVICFDKKEI